MANFIAYAGNRTWKQCDTLDEANEWLAHIESLTGSGGGNVYVDVEHLTERTLQHQTQLDNAVRLTEECERLRQQLAEARAAAAHIMRACCDNQDTALWLQEMFPWLTEELERAAESGGDRDEK